MKRKCDTCGREYEADVRNLRRGWGLCCSKSCAASKREKSRVGYDPERVKRNNVRRITWCGDDDIIDENLYGVYRGKRTAEGYKVYGETAVDEWGDPVYAYNSIEDTHPFSDDGFESTPD